MTPIEALKILDVASGRAHGTRDEHVAIANAVRVVRDALNPKESSE